MDNRVVDFFAFKEQYLKNKGNEDIPLKKSNVEEKIEDKVEYKDKVIELSTSIEDDGSIEDYGDIENDEKIEENEKIEDEIDEPMKKQQPKKISSDEMETILKKFNYSKLPNKDRERMHRIKNSNQPQKWNGLVGRGLF